MNFHKVFFFFFFPSHFNKNKWWFHVKPSELRQNVSSFERPFWEILTQHHWFMWVWPNQKVDGPGALFPPPITCKNVKINYFPFFLNFKSMLNAVLILGLKLFNLIGVEILLFTNVVYCCVSCSRTQKQNGAIERKYWHLAKTSLALLHRANVPLRFWDDGFRTTCYLINHLLTPIGNNLFSC